MTQSDGHLTNALLVRALDGELSIAEAGPVEQHLAACASCREQYEALGEITADLAALASTPAPQLADAGRARLEYRLDSLAKPGVAPSQQAILRRFGWGMAIAATLALAVVLAPGMKNVWPAASPVAAHRSIDTFEVNGETFVALPYSNADLPVSSSHVVEMQVPISSLADAGVAFDTAGSPPLDHSVLADVVVGMDGQPLGVHVLSE